MSNNSNPTKSPSFEPWMLTAYALNELSSSESAIVERELTESPKLREELDEIRTTLGFVEAAYKSSDLVTNNSVASLTPHQQSIVADAIAFASNATKSGSDITLASVPFYRRKSFVAYLAAAACVPIGFLAWNSILAPYMRLTYEMKSRASSYLDDDVDYLGDTSSSSLGDEDAIKENASKKQAEPIVSTSPVQQLESVAPESIASLQDSTQRQGFSSVVTTGERDEMLLDGKTWGDAPGSVDQQALLSQRLYSPAASGYGQHPESGTKSSDLSRSRSIDIGSRTQILEARTPRMIMGDEEAPLGEIARDTLARNASPESEARLDGRHAMGRRLPPELQNNLKSIPSRPPVATNADRYEPIVEKPFQDANAQPVTTFSIDVDTASYSKVRQTIQQSSMLPSPDMVRIEEMINYFQYEYASPSSDAPFSAAIKLTSCPWNQAHKLVRVGIQAKKIDVQQAPKCNLVFLLDVSGSMEEPNKLPLVQRAMSLLTERLREVDRVAIVVYAGAAGCVLESTPGNNKEKIQSAIYNLQAGGSTNGGEGIQLAYSIAKENFIPGGANRVILCTDGDFNVGVTNSEALVDLVKEQAKGNVFLTCLGFGAGNYNDALMEKISKDGNGVYGMVDNDREAKKLMVDQLTGTLVTVAKDVKLQMDFNPNLVRSYRLIGYENRQLANADFNNDKKDAGDIGAGHSVTALYEIVPATLQAPDLTPAGSESKYKRRNEEGTSVEIDRKPIVDESLLQEWLTLKIRYKQPEASESSLLEFVLPAGSSEEDVSRDRDLQWATSIAEFGLLLRNSKMAPNADWGRMIERAASTSGNDEHRIECVELMRTARTLAERSKN